MSRIACAEGHTCSPESGPAMGLSEEKLFLLHRIHHSLCLQAMDEGHGTAKAVCRLSRQEYRSSDHQQTSGPLCVQFRLGLRTDTLGDR